MSLIKLFINTPAPCGRKEQQTNNSNGGILMSEEVFNFMVSTETKEVKARIRSEMEAYEKQGIYKYTVRSETWEYRINYGQFVAVPIAPKTPNNFPVKMTDAVFAVMTSSETKEVKARLHAEMEEFESKGIFEYTLYSEKWEYIISYGQFIANPIAPKGQ